MSGGGTSNLQGGAISADTNVDLTISSCTFTSNSANDVSPFPESCFLAVLEHFFNLSFDLLGAFSTDISALMAMTHIALDPGESELSIALLFIHF